MLSVIRRLRRLVQKCFNWFVILKDVLWEADILTSLCFSFWHILAYFVAFVDVMSVKKSTCWSSRPSVFNASEITPGSCVLVASCAIVHTYEGRTLWTFNSPFLVSFCLRVVPPFGGNVNINKPLAACNGTSTQYMLFSAINGRVLVLIYYAALLPRRGPHIASHSVCPSVRPSRYRCHR